MQTKQITMFARQNLQITKRNNNEEAEWQIEKENNASRNMFG